MGFFSRLFSKSADDYLAKGDALFDAQQFFEARTTYEKGLQSLTGKGNEKNNASTVDLFLSRIAKANKALAEMNIGEAQSAIRRGAVEKAVEHLELAKSLSDDRPVQEIVGQLLASIKDHSGPDESVSSISSGNSCQSCGVGEVEKSSSVPDVEPDISPQDYYDLLIRQLPDEISARYALLGENFASMYLAASRDDHEKALVLLDQWYKGSDADIYWYEKGKILYRLDRISESEACFRDALRLNTANPLPHLSLALLLIDGQRLNEAGNLLDDMISANILSGQALMLRGEVDMLSGDTEGALNRFAMLLTTPLARQAAEKLHEILLQAGRDQEAAAVSKKYLGGCRH